MKKLTKKYIKELFKNTDPDRIVDIDIFEIKTIATIITISENHVVWKTLMWIDKDGEVITECRILS